MKLYFFPAVLPLVELLPWLLTAFAAVAGFLLGARGRFQRFVWPARIIFAAAVFTLAWYAWPSLYWRLNPGGSRLTGLPILHSYAASPLLELLSPKPVAKGLWREEWNVKISARAISSPLMAGGLLIFGTWDGTIDAYSARDATPIWRVQKREAVDALTIASPTLLLAGEGMHTSPGSSLTALELPSGRPLWQREFRGHIESAPTAFNNKIWLGAGPSGLWCLDALSGEVLWHAALGHVDATPLVAGGKVYFASQPSDDKPVSIFHALDAASGEAVWEAPLPGQPWGSPKLVNGMIVTSTGVGQIGINLDTDRGWAHGFSLEGQPLWTTELGGNPMEGNVALPTLGLAAFPLTNGQVVAVQLNGGKIAWRRALPGPSQSDLSVERESLTLAATLSNGELHLLDARSGADLETHRIDDGSSSAPYFTGSGAFVAGPYTLRKVRW